MKRAQVRPTQERKHRPPSQRRQPDRADRKPPAPAARTRRSRRRWSTRRPAIASSPPRSRLLALQTQNATDAITKKIDALQSDSACSVDAVHRTSQAIGRSDRARNVNARCPSRTDHQRDVRQRRRRWDFSSRSATAPPSTARPRSRGSWRTRRRGRQGRHHVRRKTHSALRGAAAPERARRRRKRERLPCNRQSEIETARGVIDTRSMKCPYGILTCGPDAAATAVRRPHDILARFACRPCRAKAGAQTWFERRIAESAELGHLGSIHDGTWDSVAGHRKPAARMTGLARKRRRAPSTSTHARADSVESGHQSALHRTRILNWAEPRC